jgi:hypothetical protein
MNLLEAKTRMPRFTHPSEKSLSRFLLNASGQFTKQFPELLIGV